VFPALRSSPPDLTRALNDGRRGVSAGRPSQRLRRALVIAELALAVILLVGAGLFIRSFGELMKVDLGFDRRNVLMAGVVLFRGETGGATRGWAALDEIAARLRAVPGVENAAGISGTIPLAGSTSMTRLEIPGRPFSHEDPDNQIFVSSVTAEYHRVMRIPLRAGRYLEETDRDGGPLVMLINQAAARRFFGADDPIGRSLAVQGLRQIVGVVGDVRQGGFETDIAATAYLPLGQSAQPSTARTAQILIRTSGDPMTVLPSVRRAVSIVLPGEPIRDARTLEAALARLAAQRRVSMVLLSSFGLLGIAIAAVSIYGIMAHVAGDRRQEIGVRMALGATRTQVMASFLREAAAMTALGLTLGAAAAWLLGSTARAFLFQIDATDPGIFALATSVLVLSALVATVLPAHRAATIDPVSALRQE
jgi:predicted permease